VYKQLSDLDSVWTSLHRAMSMDRPRTSQAAMKNNIVNQPDPQQEPITIRKILSDQ
jgi:hypothetical protein